MRGTKAGIWDSDCFLLHRLGYRYANNSRPAERDTVSSRRCKPTERITKTSAGPGGAGLSTMFNPFGVEERYDTFSP